MTLKTAIMNRVIGWRSFIEACFVFALILLSVSTFTLSKQLSMERVYRDDLVAGWRAKMEVIVHERDEQQALAQKLETDRDELLRHPVIKTKVVYYCPPPTPRFGY